MSINTPLHSKLSSALHSSLDALAAFVDDVSVSNEKLLINATDTLLINATDELEIN